MAPKPILVGVDGSTESKRALSWAAEYAELVDAPIEAVMAWQTPGSYGWPVMYDDVDFEKQARERLVQTVREVLDEKTVELRVQQGHPASVLIDASRRARLLVVGQHGRGEFHDRLLGSVSQHCVHHAQCPVVVIRGA